MDAYASADDYIKSFIQEIEVMNNNASDQTLASPQTSSIKPITACKRRRRPTLIEVETKKPGWVPKPTDDCPIVSWMADGNTFAVQNPGNKGQMLLKMEMYDGTDMVFMCGLFLDKDGEMHQSVKQVVDKVENMWIDKSTGVPKITGLTQTVTQRSAVSQPTSKKRAVRKKQRVAQAFN